MPYTRPPPPPSPLFPAEKSIAAHFTKGTRIKAWVQWSEEDEDKDEEEEEEE